MIPGFERPTQFRRRFQLSSSTVDLLLARAALAGLPVGLTLDLGTNSGTGLRFDGATTQGDVDQWLHNNLGADRFLKVTVDKAPMVDALVPTVPEGTKVLLYLSPEALTAEFDRGLASLERTLWSDPASRLAVIVLGASVALRGTQLCLCDLGNWETFTAFLEERPTLMLQAANTARLREVYVPWDEQWVSKLTPDRLFVTGQCTDGELFEALSGSFAELAALYTCDRARTVRDGGKPKGVAAEFSWTESRSVLLVDHPVRLQGAAPATLEAADSCVTWCYTSVGGADGATDMVRERLRMFQVVVSQLAPSSPTMSLRQWVDLMPRAASNAKWSWRAFLEGRVARYLEQRQALDQLVASTVSTYSGQIAALGQSLAQTMLAAVAVVVGAFIAAGFGGPFSTILVKVTLLAYAGYVAIFPFAFGMLVSLSSFRVSRDSYRETESGLAQAVSPDLVAHRVGKRVSRVQDAYFRWFTATAILYVLVVAACVVGAFELQSLASATASR